MKRQRQIQQKHNGSVETKETINWLLLWKQGCWEMFQNTELKWGYSEAFWNSHWLYCMAIIFPGSILQTLSDPWHFQKLPKGNNGQQILISHMYFLEFITWRRLKTTVHSSYECSLVYKCTVGCFWVYWIFFLEILVLLIMKIWTYLYVTAMQIILLHYGHTY